MIHIEPHTDLVEISGMLSLAHCTSDPILQAFSLSDELPDLAPPINFEELMRCGGLLGLGVSQTLFALHFAHIKCLLLQRHVKSTPLFAPLMSSTL